MYGSCGDMSDICRSQLHCAEQDINWQWAALTKISHARGRIPHGAILHCPPVVYITHCSSPARTSINAAAPPNDDDACSSVQKVVLQSILTFDPLTESHTFTPNSWSGCWSGLVFTADILTCQKSKVLANNMNNVFVVGPWEDPETEAN